MAAYIIFSFDCSRNSKVIDLIIASGKSEHSAFIYFIRDQNNSTTSRIF